MYNFKNLSLGLTFPMKTACESICAPMSRRIYKYINEKSPDCTMYMNIIRLEVFQPQRSQLTCVIIVVNGHFLIIFFPRQRDVLSKSVIKSKSS